MIPVPHFGASTDASRGERTRARAFPKKACVSRGIRVMPVVFVGSWRRSALVSKATSP